MWPSFVLILPFKMGFLDKGEEYNRGTCGFFYLPGGFPLLTVSERKVLLADLAMIFMAIFWGSGYGVSHMLLRQMSPLWLISLRFILSAVLVTAIFWRRVLLLTRKDMILSTLGGLILAGGFIFHILGLNLTTPGKQGFIQSTSVIMVPIMYAMIYKRSPGLFGFLGAVLTTLGLLVMAFTPGMTFNLGDTFSLLLAFFVALNVVSVGNFSRRMDPLGYAVVSFIAAAIIISVFAILFEPFPELTGLGSSFWKNLVYVVVMVTVMPFLIQPMAQRYSPDTHAAILQSTECLWGYAIAIAIGEEMLNWQVFLGGMIIFLGVMVTESEIYFRKRQERRKASQVDLPEQA